MLLPQETARVQKALGRTPLHWLFVLVLTVVLTVAPSVIYLSTEKGRVDHLLGRTEPVIAEVESVHSSGSCGRRSHRARYKIEVSWTTLDGTSRTGTYTRCGSPPQVGQMVEVWVGSGDHVEHESPTSSRLGLSITSLVLGGFAGLLGALIVTMQARRRRRLLTDGYLGLSHAMPVELVRGPKAALRVFSTAPVPDPAIHKAGTYVILHTQYGSEPTTQLPRHGAGPWWLRLAPSATGSRKRIGLLERQQERCWIEITTKRR